MDKVSEVRAQAEALESVRQSIITLNGALKQAHSLGLFVVIQPTKSALGPLQVMASVNRRPI